MAKKTQDKKDKPVQKPEESVKSDQEITVSMDSEASEKLERLKSLNQMLLKEAVERRQQVDSLVQAKRSLESELAESTSEREALRSELTLLGERAARMELERSVVAVFVGVQVGLKEDEFERKMRAWDMEVRALKREIDERECEIRRLNGKLSEVECALGNEREGLLEVWKERDEFEDKFNRQIEESKGLREKLIEFEERKRAIEREIEELRVTYIAVVGDKEEMEMTIKSLLVEKESIENGLMESNNLIDHMKEEFRRVVRAKDGVEEEKNVEMVKRQELENAVGGLNEIVINLQKEEAKLQVIVAELEKRCVEGEKRQKEMGKDIDHLVKEKKLSEKRIQDLADEKTAIENEFKDALMQLAGQKQKIEDMVDEKIVMMEAKGRVDDEVGTLQNQVAKLKAVVLELEASNRADMEKIRSLESEVGDCRCKLEQFNVERKVMECRLDEEKQNFVRMKELIVELECKIEESHKAAEELKAENTAIIGEKIELESRCEMLKKEITSLQTTIIEMQNKFNSMKVKVEVADANSGLVLNMLKGTAAFCSKDESDGEFDVLLDDGEETKLHAMELETIKNAFKSQVLKVEDMKRQLECLQISVENARKKKSFWNVLSSATTLLAAISLAYVARGH